MEYKGEGVRREGLVWIKMEYKGEGVKKKRRFCLDKDQI